MALDIDHFSKLRPYLYHLTGRGNIVHIQKDMALKCSNTLFAEAGAIALSRTVRRGPCLLRIGERQVQIRDQDPLHAGKIAFSGGWELPDLVEHLNKHVFFWPGWDGGLVTSGEHHFERYSEEKPRPIILRVAVKELLSENTGTKPFLCLYNSGAPRCTQGHGSPRGPSTFLSADTFDLPPSRVVEVTFRSTMKLPLSVQAAASLEGPWQRLMDLLF